MFIGEYTHSIDSKGRLSIPVKFRVRLSEGAVVTRGLDKCLFLYTKADWDDLVKKLITLPISQKNARAFGRLMLAGAMEVVLDKQGRINLPQYLQEYANLKEEAVLAGLYNRIEIWNKDAWTEYKEKAEKESTEISEHLGELGI